MADSLFNRLLEQHARTWASSLRAIAEALDAAAPDPVARVGIVLFTTPEGVVTVADIEVRDDSPPRTAAVRFLNAKGNETPPDDVPTWTSSDEEVATVEASEDGTSATVTIVGKTGATLIEVKSTEADTSEEIVSSGTVTVVPSSTAVRGEVTFAEA
jgi:hypothetical protein